MTVLSYEFDADVCDFKAQRASRRAASLKKDKAEYKQKSSVSYGRKASAAPVGSDFATPHRSVRAATRTCLAKGAIVESSDMPQATAGHAGYWVRWARKPSVSKSSKMPIEELDTDSSIRVSSEQKWFNEQDSTDSAQHENENDSSAPWDIDVDNETIFPALASQPATPSPKSTSETDVMEQETTPEKHPEGSTKTEMSAQEIENDISKCDEMAEEWVIISSDDARASTSSRMAVTKSFDAQHPRNMFAKDSASKSAVSRADPVVGAGIDWSQAGMPIELIRRLVRGSVNPAHHGPHCDKKANQVPIDVMRAQNMGSAKRQSSTPKTPRSQSKSRRPLSRSR